MKDIKDGYCKCGCNERTNIHRGKPRKFIAGHQARGICNSRYGINLSKETKSKISKANKGKLSGEKNPFYGKTHSSEVLKIISEKNLDRPKRPLLGLNKICLLPTCNKSFYVPISRSNSSYCSRDCKDLDNVRRFSGENNPFYGKTHTEETKEKIRKHTLIQRANNTWKPSKPELIIQKLLTELGITFVSEHIINDKFCVDIYIPECNLVIFIDGCYWHACEYHYPNAKKPQTDNARIPYLTKCGYNVEIIWEHDISKGKKFPTANPNKILKTLLDKYIK